MRTRLGVLGLVCAMGFANAAFAQDRTNVSAQPAVDLTNRAPQVAALTNQFHVLDARVGAPVEIAPPGTVDDDSDVDSNRIATDMPRRLLSAVH